MKICRTKTFGSRDDIERHILLGIGVTGYVAHISLIDDAICAAHHIGLVVEVDVHHGTKSPFSGSCGRLSCDQHTSMPPFVKYIPTLGVIGRAVARRRELASVR